MTDTIQDMLWDLEQQGCYPSIYRRGKLWRAHVNACGNWWEDAASATDALKKAISHWVAAGKPMDGMAAEAEGKA